MQALELVKDRKTKEPAPQAVLAVFEETKRRGVLIGKGGLYGNVIRTGLPLNATRDHVDELAAALDHGLDLRRQSMTSRRPDQFRSALPVTLSSHDRVERLQEVHSCKLASADRWLLLSSLPPRQSQSLTTGRPPTWRWANCCTKAGNSRSSKIRCSPRNVGDARYNDRLPRETLADQQRRLAAERNFSPGSKRFRAISFRRPTGQLRHLRAG